MTDVSDFLAIDAIDANLTAANKKALFQHFALMASSRVDAPQKAILAALTDREKLGSTGFGGGVAIPHGKIDTLPRLFGYFARLSTPIAFDSIDGLPVDLVFLLLSPADAGADHLKALASVSRAAWRRRPCRGARSKDAIFALLAGTESAHAA